LFDQPQLLKELELWPKEHHPLYQVLPYQINVAPEDAVVDNCEQNYFCTHSGDTTAGGEGAKASEIASNTNFY
jgi:hypothetical protein